MCVTKIKMVFSQKAHFAPHFRSKVSQFCKTYILRSGYVWKSINKRSLGRISSPLQTSAIAS